MTHFFSGITRTARIGRCVHESKKAWDRALTHLRRIPLEKVFRLPSSVKYFTLSATLYNIRVRSVMIRERWRRSKSHAKTDIKLPGCHSVILSITDFAFRY